jgi:hypothetical protein
MIWGDPSQADTIPDKLQKENTRYAFGKRQFQSFMMRTGANVLIRGHEKVDGGFELVYDDADLKLITLFSAGGEFNEDLPQTSSYRGVTPMAMAVRYRAGVQTGTPWAIDYRYYNAPERNGLFASPPEIPYRAP